MISKVKLQNYDFIKLENSLINILNKTLDFIKNTFDDSFDFDLKRKIKRI